jgi:hypothetical protein
VHSLSERLNQGVVAFVPRFTQSVRGAQVKWLARSSANNLSVFTVNHCVLPTRNRIEKVLKAINSTLLKVNIFVIFIITSCCDYGEENRSAFRDLASPLGDRIRKTILVTVPHSTTASEKEEPVGNSIIHFSAIRAIIESSRALTPLPPKLCELTD